MITGYLTWSGGGAAVRDDFPAEMAFELKSKRWMSRSYYNEEVWPRGVGEISR